MSETQDEQAFQVRVGETLQALLDALELEDDGIFEELELQDGVLTLELEDGQTYILNRHLPTRQLWLSSPVSGAHHFGWREDAWRTGEQELCHLLVAELEGLTGRRFSL